jgi:hypothetical protein
MRGIVVGRSAPLGGNSGFMPSILAETQGLGTNPPSPPVDEHELLLARLARLWALVSHPGAVDPSALGGSR